MMNKLLILFIIATIVSFNGFSQEVKTLKLTTHMVGKMKLHDGNKINIWGFLYSDSIADPNAPNQLPSPVLEFTEGDSIYMIVDNGSNLPHTIHLHGMDVGQANDGVPCTSFKIEGYKTGTYRLRAKHTGTFLYHCHFETHIHLQMGMYGAVIVRPKSDPKTVYDAATRFTKEYIWLASEIDADWHKQELTNGNQPSYHPNYFLLNGKEKHQLKSDPKTAVEAYIGDTVLLRLANMGYGINKYYFPSELNAHIIGSDGRKFEEVEFSDTIMVYPGERYDVFVRSNKLIRDSVKIEYLSNYRNELWGENFIPITIGNIPLNFSTLESDFSFTIQETDVLLQFTNQANREAALYNISGKLISKSTSSALAFTLDRKSVKQGVYVIKVFENGRSMTRKVIIR
jgi:hypothetical protein